MSGHIGIFGNEDINVAPLLHWSLYALQHRGEVGSGLVVVDDDNISQLRGPGLVSDIYKEEEINSLKGNKGAAHVRYAFEDDDINAPFLPEVFPCEDSQALLSIDGNFLEKALSRKHIADFLCNEKDLPEKIKNLKGAYSIIHINKDRMIAIRDPWGIKNLVLGKYDNSYVVASETAAIDSIGAEFLRDILPGEIVTIDKDGLRSQFTGERQEKNCIFEYVYIARQDSYIEGKSVYEARYNMGRRLAEEEPVNGDLVIGAPDSGTIAALGYSHESRIPYKEGILKNRYVGRSFILPDQRMREKAVKIKMNPLKKNLDGKRVILVDDSIVRGTTIKSTVKMLRDAGAIEVHVRIACPPVKHSCDLCVDTPDEKYLIGANLSVEETCKEICADSLAYLSLDSLVSVCGGNRFCKHCFDGKYPIEVENGNNL